MIKTFEGYYNPPDNGYDPLYEGIIDRLYTLIQEKHGADDELVELYIDHIEKNDDIYEQVLNIIDETQNSIIDDNGNYPWTEEIKNLYKNFKNYYQKIKYEINKKLQLYIVDILYKKLEEIFPFENFKIKYNADKFNI